MMQILENSKIIKRRGKPIPLYRQVEKLIRDNIRSETIKAGERLPSVSEMVKEWDVAYQTVQAALNSLERDGMIRIESGRGKGAVVLGLDKTERKHTMSFLKWCPDSLFITLERGARKFAEEHGDELITIDAKSSTERYCDIIAHPPKDVEGHIFWPYELKLYEQAVASAIKNGVKIVFVDRVLPSMIDFVSSVTADHFGGGYMATKHLVEQHGIGVHFFGWVDQPSSAYERCQGWRAAMSDYNYNADDFIWELPLSEAEEDTKMSGRDLVNLNNQAALKAMSKCKQKKYCVFTVGDDYARSIYFAAKELNLRIGKDVFVVGFGDKPFCRSYSVPLSSISIPNEQIGYEAARLLRQCICGEQKRPLHRTLPVKLEIRTSSVG
jgi:DNA-binding LacI/PurR family transcriptional regulator